MLPEQRGLVYPTQLPEAPSDLHAGTAVYPDSCDGRAILRSLCDAGYSQSDLNGLVCAFYSSLYLCPWLADLYHHYSGYSTDWALFGRVCRMRRERDEEFARLYAHGGIRAVAAVLADEALR